MPRITGKLGRVYLAAEPGAVVQIADVFNWEANLTAVPLNCSIKGDTFDRFVLSHGSGTITAERYIQTFATFAGFISTTISAGTRVSFELYAINNSASSSKITGFGYITRADVAAPHAKMTDRIEIQIDEVTLTLI